MSNCCSTVSPGASSRATTGKLVPAQGLIPVPPDYETALVHDFATFEDGSWRFLETGPDRAQMLFGEPLTLEQMQALANAAGGPP